MEFQLFFRRSWYGFLDPQAQLLAIQAVELEAREKRLHSLFDDYSFLVFPMAKAYESFLKKLAFEMGLIDRNQYEGKQFRIGRSFNPDVSLHQRNEDWLYDNIVGGCGEKMARDLWNTWLECRNHLFHYFPDQNRNITLDQARELLCMMDTTMEEALNCLKRRR